MGGSPAAPASSAPSSDGLRIKTGAGSTSLATAMLANDLQGSVPGLDRFTAFNDPYHMFLGNNSAHSRGEALDFTIKNVAQSAAVAAQVRQKLASMGVDAKVIDEYTNPSAGSTGGHIHVQFSSASAAARYASAYRGIGGGTSAVRSGGDVNTSAVTIGAINVYPPNGDADTIARTIKPAMERANFAASANSGQQ
jgi:hypothetical protein